MVTPSHVIKTLSTQIGTLLAPSKEDGLVVELASLVVGRGNLSNDVLSQLADEGTDRAQSLICFFDHRHLKTIPLAVHHGTEHINLGCSNLPVRTVALLDVSNLDACILDSRFEITPRLERLKAVQHNLGSCHLPQVH